MISICQGMLDKRALPDLSGAKEKKALSAKWKMENSWNHVSILPWKIYFAIQNFDTDTFTQQGSGGKC